MTLLQNEATIYYKTRHLFLLKIRQIILRNTEAFLLRNKPFSLKNAAGVTKCAVFITQGGRYYKMRLLLQNAAQDTLHNEQTSVCRTLH